VRQDTNNVILLTRNVCACKGLGKVFFFSLEGNCEDISGLKLKLKLKNKDKTRIR
jgi:hypothetical protein